MSDPVHEVKVWHLAWASDGFWERMPLCWQRNGQPDDDEIDCPVGQTKISSDVTCRECIELMHA